MEAKNANLPTDCKSEKSKLAAINLSVNTLGILAYKIMILFLNNAD